MCLTSCRHRSLLCEQAQLTYKLNISPRRKSGAYRPKKKSSGLARDHIWSDITHPDPLLNLSVWLSGKWIIDTRILPRATQSTDRKTLWSLLLLRAYSWTAWSSRFVNPAMPPDYSHILNGIAPPISMQTVMNSGGYFCMAISTFKQCDLGSYKKIITCKSCNYVDVDPKYPYSQRQLSRV